MTVDLSQNPDSNWALYVPAISSSYVHWVSQWDKKINLKDKNGKPKTPDRNPKKLSKDGKEMFFLEPDNGAFYYNCGLYSAGHANIDDLKKSQSTESMIHRRDKKNTLMIADSGGFQIASGAQGSSVSNFDWNDIYSKENDEIRLNILRWMESVADYSMTLDIPTVSIENPKTPLKYFKDCMDVSRYNAEFFVKHRTPGATKILNTLHGRNTEETDIWWDEFKDFPFEGWAIGGIQKYNMELLLRRLIIMRDSGYLGGDRNWVHVLGVSRLSFSCILTEIQRALRSTVDPNITVSYDSASPFVGASKGLVYSHENYEGGKRGEKFSYMREKMIESREVIRSDKAFPFASIPARFLTIGDICSRDPQISGTATTWDSFSYVLLMWHNLYRQIEGIQQALRIYDMPSDQVTSWVPQNLLEFKELCPEIFASSKPFELIEKNKKLLHKLTGVNGEKHVPILEQSGSGLFSWDNGDSLQDSEELLCQLDGREQEVLSMDNF